MGAGNKLSIALLIVVLAVGLAACGGDDDSSSSTTEAALQDGPPVQSDDGGGSTGEPGEDSGGGKSDSGAGEEQSSDAGSSDESDSFVPEQHDDSGGGSAQFKVKGGDNSVQEFGAEADTSDRDAAAAALHNFLDARAAEAWESACSYLSTEVRESLEAFAVKAQEAAAKQGKAEQAGDTSCAGILGKLTNRAALPQLREEAAQADVGSLRVEGDRAFVIYRGLEGTIIAMPVTSEDGSWKVASLAGTPLN